MNFDFSKLPWKQWADSLVRSAIWRIVMSVPWWLLAILVGGAMLVIALQ